MDCRRLDCGFIMIAFKKNNSFFNLLIPVGTFSLQEQIILYVYCLYHFMSF